MPSIQTTPNVSTFSPTVGRTPTRKANERDLDAFNKQLRVSPLYQNFMRSRGLPTDGHAKLSDKQQGELERAMAQAGFAVPKGMHIDQSGNLNQKSHLVRNVLIGAALAAGTVATLGAAGVIGGGVLGGFGLGSAGAASVPGAVGGAVPLVGEGIGSSLAAVPTVVGATSGAAGAAGAAGTAATLGGVTAPVFGSAAAAAPTAAIGATAPTFAASSALPLASSAGPISSAAPLAAVTTSVPAGVTGGGSAMGLGAKDWIDIGKTGWDAFTGVQGNRAANAANTQASDVTDRYNQQLLQLTRDQMAATQTQQDKINAANERNFAIQEQTRLEDLRRQDELEAESEPHRLAKEAGYRQYMKKYYGIDVGPSVNRTPRQFSATPTTTATGTAAPASSLAAQAAPGAAYQSIIPDTPIQAATLPGQMGDPSWFYQNPTTDTPYRRSMQSGDA